MNKQSTIYFLKMLNRRKIKDRGSWVMSECIFEKWFHQGGIDTHPSFGISIGASSIFHCFGCGRGGDIHKIPTMLSFLTGKDFPELQEFIALHNIVSSLPDYDRPVRARVTYLAEATLKAFEQLPLRVARSRFINKESIKQWGLLYDSLSNLDSERIVFPIRDITGGLVGIRGRLTEKVTDRADKLISYKEFYPSNHIDPKKLECGMVCSFLW